MGVSGEISGLERVRHARGVDARTGRGDGDAAAASSGVGLAADCGGAGLQSHDGAAVSCDGGMAALSAARTPPPAGAAHELADRALRPASGQCRRGAPGPGARTRGRQLQIDFGETQVPIGEASVSVSVHLFVATLGYSRRLFCQPFRHQRQSARLAGLEAAFRHFGGIPRDVLVDNPRALVDYPNIHTREMRFNAGFLVFARDWGFTPRAGAPTGRGQKARTSAASARSSTMRLPGIASPAGRRWRRIWRAGCAMSPTCADTARRTKRPACGSTATRPRRCNRWRAAPRSLRHGP